MTVINNRGDGLTDEQYKRQMDVKLATEARDRARVTLTRAKAQLTGLQRVIEAQERIIADTTAVIEGNQTNAG